MIRTYIAAAVLTAMAMIATPALAQTEERCSLLTGRASDYTIEGRVARGSGQIVVLTFPCYRFTEDKRVPVNGRFVLRNPEPGAAAAPDPAGIAEAERRGWNAARAAIVIPPQK